jgi:hypothetical protein
MNCSRPTRLRTTARAAALLASCCCIAPAFAQNLAGDRRVMLEEQRQHLEAFFQGQPMLDVSRINEVFLLRTEGARLVWEAPVIDRVTRTPGEQFRARLRELGDGLTTIYLGRTRVFGGDDGMAAPGGPESVTESRTFSLTHYDFSTPGVVETLSVQAQHNYFHVDCSAQLAEGYRSVRISEQGPQLEVPTTGPRRLGSRAAAFGEGTANLTITVADKNGRPQMLNLVEPDFQSLVRRHPREIEEHVRPLFRRLGQDAVFAPDPLVAWQVFADHWAGDESMRRRVEAILPGLGAVDFRARDRALGQLVALGRPAAAVLLRMDRSKLSPEQSLRVDRALLPYMQLPAGEASRLRSDPGFLLDCLYVEDPALRRVALERLREVTGQPIAFNETRDLTRRANAVAELRQKLQPVLAAP